MESDSQVEKKTLLQAADGVSEFICVAALTTEIGGNLRNQVWEC